MTVTEYYSWNYSFHSARKSCLLAAYSFYTADFGNMCYLHQSLGRYLHLDQTFSYICFRWNSLLSNWQLVLSVIEYCRLFTFFLYHFSILEVYWRTRLFKSNCHEEFVGLLMAANYCFLFSRCDFEWMIYSLEYFIDFKNFLICCFWILLCRRILNFMEFLKAKSCLVLEKLVLFIFKSCFCCTAQCFCNLDSID
jgi:hypothetical protein